MPVTLKDIRDHREHFGIDDISKISIDEYKQLLSSNTFFWIDHHDAVRHQLSGEVIAYYPKQIDALIELLKSYKQRMLESGRNDFD